MKQPLLILQLPFPPAELGPNSRGHWTAKARAVEDYRKACWVITLNQLGGVGAKPFDGVAAVELKMIFHCPSKSRYGDLDNFGSRMKSGIDGIFDACRANDRIIKKKSEVFATPTKMGFVEMIFSEYEGE